MKPDIFTTNNRSINIVGAGPAGLSAALIARKMGCTVNVYEQFSDVGGRFHGDFQGLENWTQDNDVLTELSQLDIHTDFDHTPVYEIVCFDSSGRSQVLRSLAPIFYLIHRGKQTGSIDQALKAQAIAAGVSIKFNTRTHKLQNGGVVADGPHRANAIAVGYVFETDMADGSFVVITDELAPSGYSYLIVNRGRGTVASCMFKDFHNERTYAERTVDFFKRHANLRWTNAKRFGGRGNFGPISSAISGMRLYAGEAAGFQDALFGFGLRYALISGHLAGTAFASSNPSSYDKLWHTKLRGLKKASLGNRWLFAHMGERGRRAVLNNLVIKRDPRRVLAQIYAPAWWKNIFANFNRISALLQTEQVHEDCDCTWCRCERSRLKND